MVVPLGCLIIYFNICMPEL